jgi:hypothetical protein
MWVLVACILFIAGLSKLIRGGFVLYLASTAMFPAPTLPYVAAAVITLELLGATLLVWPRYRYQGWLLVAGLSATFLVFHVFAAGLGDVIASRCLGVQVARERFWNHVLMGAICLFMLAAAFLACRRRRAAAARGEEATS